MQMRQFIKDGFFTMFSDNEIIDRVKAATTCLACICCIELENKISSDIISRSVELC